MQPFDCSPPGSLCPWDFSARILEWVAISPVPGMEPSSPVSPTLQAHSLPTRTSLVTQTVKRLPTMWETLVQSLGREDPLEKEEATHSSSCLENPMDGGAW